MIYLKVVTPNNNKAILLLTIDSHPFVTPSSFYYLHLWHYRGILSNYEYIPSNFQSVACCAKSSAKVSTFEYSILDRDEHVRDQVHCHNP